MVDLEIVSNQNGTQPKRDSAVITLAEGIRLEIFRPNRMAIVRAHNLMLKNDPEPQVPEVWSDDKGRAEPNPNDPVYKQAMLEWYDRQGTRYLDVYIATGSRLVEPLPEGVLSQDSEDFLGLLELTGDEPSRTAIQRYVQWVKLVAMPDPEYIEQFQKATQEFSDATEEQIAEATAKFRSQTE